MEKVSFSSWTLQDLERVFKLKRHKSVPALDRWLNVGGEFTEQDLATLESLREKSLMKSAYWSEDELKFFLLAPLIDLARFPEPLCFFAGRSLSGTVGDYELNGIVDGMVATGEYHPEAPYFCMHEYKRADHGRQEDPAAQVMAAMLAAREHNAEPDPIYGAYVQGRLWFFLALVGNDYAISTDYSTANESIREVVLILRNLSSVLPPTLFSNAA